MNSGIPVLSGELASPVEKIRPWYCSYPYRLLSWWDMQRFSARAFYLIGIEIGFIPSSVAKEAEEQAFPIQCLEEPASEALAKLTKAKATTIEEWCRTIDLDFSAEYARRMAEKLDKPMMRNEILRQMGELRQRITDEMKGKLFMYIPPYHARFYGVQEPFGSEVAEKFPSIAFDAMEAGNCYACERSTACVFHLMRILETVLVVLGKPFNVTVTHTNWNTAIEQIEARIRDMHSDPVWKSLSDWKDQREFYSQAVSYLGVVKDAWRNFTAHARGKYTQEEARLMMMNIKSFMEKISQRVSE